MFHTTHIHVPRNRRPSALRTFITSSSFGPPDTKEPLRRGILLTAVAFVLLLIGSILTWLGFNDVFGGRMSMTGPLLIALSLLLLLLSFRQFLLARKRNPNNRSSMQLDSVNAETVTAVVVNRDDGLHPATIIVDRYNRIGYDGSVTVHRHSDDDCAPPSYHEVTQLSSSSNTPSCITHDGQDELPPTYEETMGSSIYPPHALVSSASPFLLNGQQERGSIIPASIPSVAISCGEPGGDISSAMSARVPQADVTQRNVMSSMGGMFPHYGHKSSPMPALPRLQLETVSGVEQGLTASSQNVSVCPMLQPPQHSLALPPQHLSAPDPAGQLSVSPSPQSYSAPPSPRLLIPRQHIIPPPQYVSTSHSARQLSAPPSLHMLSATRSYHSYSSPPSPHTFSAPASPRLLSGQQSLTPPPQYTSAPPSPHQLSAPTSPLLFSTPRSPCFPPVPSSMHPLSPQPSSNPFSVQSVSHQLPGPPPPHQFSAPVPHQPWAPAPKVGSNQEGYTCFTYNFVTPLPVETSPSVPILHGHTSTVSYPVGSCAASSAHHHHHPESIGDSMPSHSVAPLHAIQGTLYLGQEGMPTASLQPDLNVQGASESSQRTFSSRTDIQASI